MKMDLNELMRITKEHCNSVARVYKRHTKDTEEMSSMKAYRAMAQGRLNGIIETAINIYAYELVGEDNTYWENVNELRSYENKIESEISEEFGKWYTKYLNRL